MRYVYVLIKRNTAICQTAHRKSAAHVANVLDNHTSQLVSKRFNAYKGHALHYVTPDPFLPSLPYLSKHAPGPREQNLP